MTLPEFLADPHFLVAWFVFWTTVGYFGLNAWYWWDERREERREWEV